MLCQNCSYILSGKENFCPNCGTMPYGQIKKTEKKETEVKKESTRAAVEITPESYPPYKPLAPVTRTAKSTDIFGETEEVHSVREKAADEKASEVKAADVKNPVGKIFILLFITCTLAVTAFGLADYFGVTQTVSGFVQTLSQKDAAKEEPVTESFSHEMSIVEPEINYSMTTAYILSGYGLTLRKGPSNSYAPIHSLTDLTKVQIFGGSIANRSWVYVYCPEKECYGWLDGSFLTSESMGEATLNPESGEVQFEIYASQYVL